MTYYVAPHLAQTNYSWITKTSGCTWTSVAVGIAATTGGAKKPSPDYIHSLVPRYAETNPETPGWSIPDAVRSVARYASNADYPVSLANKSGSGWAGVIAQLIGGHYVVLQGDSDQFGNNTCSGAFNGDHCVGVHPRSRYVNGQRQWWIDDPICPSGRYEYETVLRRYAEKLDTGIRFGAFVQKVPTLEATYSVSVKPDYAFFRYGLVRRSRERSANGFSASCSAPSYRVTIYGRKRLVTVTSGAYKGWVLDADNTPPVTVKES